MGHTTYVTVTEPELKKSQSFECGTHKCPNIVLGDIIFMSLVKMNLSSALEGDIIFIFQVQSTWFVTKYVTHLGYLA